MTKLTKKQKIRRALRMIESLSNDMSEGIYRDKLMDGSGECGEFIYKGWSTWFHRKLNKCLQEYNLTLQELRTTADSWANVELARGPKETYIYFSRKSRVKKAVDYFDTRWGSIAFTLDSLNAN